MNTTEHKAKIEKLLQLANGELKKLAKGGVEDLIVVEMLSLLIPLVAEAAIDLKRIANATSYQANIKANIPEA